MEAKPEAKKMKISNKIKLPEIKREFDPKELLIGGERIIHTFGKSTLTDRRVIKVVNKDNIKSIELSKVSMVSIDKKQRKQFLIGAIVAACAATLLLFYDPEMASISIFSFIVAAGLLAGYIFSIKEVVTLHTSGGKLTTMSGAGATVFLTKIEESISRKK